MALSAISLESIRPCLEGAVPAAVATCDAAGVPNLSLVSEVHYVDAAHVALSFQFFSKTRANILANPRATVIVIHPESGARYQLELEYQRTETEGPLFESMKAKLAGIAAHTGMSGVFRLRGSDVYRVLSIEAVPGATLAPAAPPRNLLPALRHCAGRLAVCTDLSGLLETMLDCLESQLAIRNAMILVLDAANRRLYTLASRGYENSGVGSEIPLGQGIIGIAAEQRTPIRITHMTSDYSYGRAIRESALQVGLAGVPETAIPLPGLPESRSQLAVPIVAGGELLGALFVESPEELRFGYDDEDALVALATQLGMGMHILRQLPEPAEEADRAVPAPAPGGGAAVIVRYYAADGSVFIGEDYLIKGVAGAIFFRLVSGYEQGRGEFTNRELRLDPTLGLPDVSDNLEARLVLLERRLAERCAFLRIEKTGRGRFRLDVRRALRLVRIEP